jgi:hypothetical protein
MRGEFGVITGYFVLKMSFLLLIVNAIENFSVYIYEPLRCSHSIGACCRKAVRNIA